MDFIKDAFTRMDLGSTRQFLLYGADEFDYVNQPYMDRLKTGSDPIHARLKNLYANKPELDEAIADLTFALDAYESVYMELGMKAGARLLYQLLLTDDHSPTEITKAK